MASRSRLFRATFTAVSFLCGGKIHVAPAACDNFEQRTPECVPSAGLACLVQVIASRPRGSFLCLRDGTFATLVSRTSVYKDGKPPYSMMHGIARNACWKGSSLSGPQDNCGDSQFTGRKTPTTAEAKAEGGKQSTGHSRLHNMGRQPE